MSGEPLASAETVRSFDDAAKVISKIAPIEEDSDCWDAAIPKLELHPEVAKFAGLGSAVRCRVIGDPEGGVAIVMRSRNLFNTSRVGFYIQPRDGSDFSSFEVWSGTGKWPKRNRAYWGIELLKGATKAPTEVADSLIASLQSSA
jgi:hypothetical protein